MTVGSTAVVELPSCCYSKYMPILGGPEDSNISRTAFIIIHRTKSKTNCYFCVFDFPELFWYFSANLVIPSKISCRGLGRLSPNFQYMPL